ncbi:helix-turn-helix domain-containing protein [Nonomuraea candida]|uniref:helix-turn-helix domain-containing protein n=1 Tax=Nonomuraea candida TaxID=359159 RepID=UPI0014703291|nr:helix-turn-helix domain-containing protein [Nonomuraea candida]
MIDIRREWPPTRITTSGHREDRGRLSYPGRTMAVAPVPPPVPVALSGGPRGAFLARVRVRDLGAVTVTSLTTRTGAPYRIEGAPHGHAPDGQAADGQAADGQAAGGGGEPAAYQLVLQTRGRLRVAHAGGRAVLGPSRLALYDASLPFRAEPEPGGGPAACVLVAVPRELMPVPARAVRRLLGVPLSAETGIGALAAGTLARIADDLDRYRPPDAFRLSGLVVDLLAALVAHELETRSPAAPGRADELLLLRVQSFILRHLGDPDLSPRGIAAAHHISLRSLHRLFSGHGDSVCGWIRRRRLERCRRDLADPLLAGHPVHAIAARWGLGNPAHFSQLFRAAYEVNPGAYRAAALRPPGSAVRHADESHLAPIDNDR